MSLRLHKRIGIGISVLLITLSGSLGPLYVAAQSTQSGSIGIEGVVPGEPPTRGAVISFPTNGQSFTAVPITVTGICPTGLLVKLFKNNVFGGAAECVNGSFSIVTDLFSGQNDLVAKVYDALDQAGPDSPTVSVTFNDNRASFGTRVALTSIYARRGASPGSTLDWPIVLSGGSGPYAISIDWGDGTEPDLKSQAFPGNFTIEHIYASAGVYNIIVKATDSNGFTAFLQLVGVGNGPVSQSAETTADEEQAIIRTRVIWQPVLIMLALVVLAFWLGQRHSLQVLRQRLEDAGRRD